MGDFGLMFYNARWYDPYLNHFTQPDTIVPDPSNSQSYDRYAYALNNPLRYTDPTGHVSCAGANWDDGPQCFVDGKPKNIRIDWDPNYDVSEKDKKAAIKAYLNFLSDPLQFADYYVNPKNAPLDYDALEVFAEYTTSHTTADHLITNWVASSFGMGAMESLQQAREENLEASMSHPGNTAGGITAAGAIIRSLTAEDLGIEGLVYLRGTFTVEDGVATVKVDMIAGEIENPLTLMSNLSDVAQAEGANVLRIQATVVNERLYNILTKRYGMTSVGGTDYIQISLTENK